LPYRVVAQQALARWRAAQAQMGAASPDSSEWVAAYVEEALTKAPSHDAVEAARREHLPERPPFEEVAS
jgi:hypothetical protein